MKLHFESNLEPTNLEKLKNIIAKSDKILTDQLRDITTDILQKSFSEYKITNSRKQTMQLAGTFIGLEIRKLLENHTEDKISNKNIIDMFSELRSETDSSENRFFYASRKIFSMNYDELCLVLKINKNMGILHTIDYLLKDKI